MKNNILRSISLVMIAVLAIKLFQSIQAVSRGRAE